MTTPQGLLNLLLIAKTDPRLESLAGGFQRDRAKLDSSDVALFLIGLVVVCLLIGLVAKWTERRSKSDSSFSLFWLLAKTHKVGWSDRWLLWRIARMKSLREPALVFLDPRLTSPRFLDRLAAGQIERLKTLRRGFFLGIDHASDPPSEPAIEQSARNVGHSLDRILTASPSAHVDNSSPSVGATHSESTAGVAETARSEQVDDNRAPVASVEFPASGSPSLDLYPWLDNDWEITNAEK